MRERWARWLAALTGAIVLLLSAAFALLQNRGGSDPAGNVGVVAAPTVDAAQLKRGLAVYDAQGCMRCHSIAGRGSPRSPLDGVADRLDRDAMRAFVTADARIAQTLPARIRSAKEDYADLPAEQLDALLDFLQSLRADGPNAAGPTAERE